MQSKKWRIALYRKKYDNIKIGSFSKMDCLYQKKIRKEINSKVKASRKVKFIKIKKEI